MSRKIEEIKEIAKLTNHDLEYLQNSKLPLVLFGAAELAHAVKSLLDANSIAISYAVVDRQFYKPQQYFYEIPVTLFDDVLKKEKEFNVIVTFSSEKYLEKIKELEKIQQIKKVIFFDVFQCYDYDFDFVNTHYTVFKKLFFQLRDNLSRDVFLEFIRAKNLKNSKELMKFNVPNEEQYFPDFLHLNESEIFVDCGAYDGDSVLRFAKYAKENFNKIYAFECDEKNIQKFLNNTKRYEDKIKLVKKGAWSKAGDLNFSNAGSSGSRIEDGGIKILVDSIENVVKDEPVSFIKMDIEGAELEALRGAENTIRKYKPKLAISVYHKQEDLITIPQYILSIHNDYRLYLRHYGTFVTELILYAI
jgi:FkbM family methyltransferase